MQAIIFFVWHVNMVNHPTHIRHRMYMLYILSVISGLISKLQTAGSRKSNLAQRQVLRRATHMYNDVHDYAQYLCKYA